MHPSPCFTPSWTCASSNITIRIYKALFHQDHSAHDFGVFCCHSRNTGAIPFSFTISVLGSFTSHPKDGAIAVKCLAQGHECCDRPGRDLNSHSDNTRTWAQRTRPLGHDTPYHTPFQRNPTAASFFMWVSRWGIINEKTITINQSNDKAQSLGPTAIP